MTYDEVNAKLTELDAGNGFWDRTATELIAMADAIDALTGVDTTL